MATNTVKVTLQIRHDDKQDWLARNPVLAAGEFALETDISNTNSFLLKIGDGIRDWEHLPYLNRFDTSYFSQNSNGDITLNPTFVEQINNLIAQAGGDAKIVITDDPVEQTDPVNLRYLQWAIAHAGHLSREVVAELPAISEANENTIYLVASSTGVGYEEYMLINGAWDMVGVTNDSQAGYELPIATAARLGGVKSAPLSPSGEIMKDKDYIVVDNTGFMTFNQVSTSKLYVPTGDVLVIYGGTA